MIMKASNHMMLSHKGQEKVFQNLRQDVLTVFHVLNAVLVMNKTGP
jgi:hypothetical protein